MRKIQKISHSHVAFEALRCPVPLLKSSLGTLCLTTHDLQEDIADKFVCQLDIGDFMNKSFGNTGYAELIKKPNNQVRLMCSRNMDENLVYLHSVHYIPCNFAL